MFKTLTEISMLVIGVEVYLLSRERGLISIDPLTASMSNLYRNVRGQGMLAFSKNFENFPTQLEKDEFMQGVIADFTNPNYHLCSLMYSLIPFFKVTYTSTCTIAQKPETICIDTNGNMRDVMRKRHK